MLKGSVIVFTYLITLFYLKRSLSTRKHIYMGVIIASLLAIGTSNIDNQEIPSHKCIQLIQTIIID